MNKSVFTILSRVDDAAISVVIYKNKSCDEA